MAYPGDPEGHKNKRSPAQISADLAFIELWHWKGKNIRALTEMLNAKNPYSLSRSSVKADLKRCDNRWRQEQLKTRDENVRKRIDAIDNQLDELWQAWDKSKKDATKKSISDETGQAKGGKKKTSIVMEGQCGDVGIMRLIRELGIDRDRLLGLEAPTKTEITGSDGGPLMVVLESDFNPEEVTGPAHADTDQKD